MEDGWWIKAVRGAIKVERDEEEEVIKKGKKLMEEIMRRNRIKREDIICVFFTITNDLKSISPGRIIREMGFKEIPVLCSQEPTYKNSLPSTLRVLALYYTKEKEVNHVYMGEAKTLRPDL